MSGRAWLASMVATLLLALPLSMPAHADDPAWEDAEHEVHLSVRLDPSSRQIQGDMVVRPPPRTDVFQLKAELEVSEAMADGASLPLEKVSAGRYRLTVPQEAESVTLRWNGLLETDSGRLMVSPEGSLLPAASGWHPQFAELGPFALHIEVQVPDGQRVVATGSLVDEPRNDEAGYRVRHYHPRTEWVELATGPWLERQHGVGDVRIRTLFPAELDDAHAETYLEHASRYLAQFSERVGPYPYDSFTIAASPAPLGLAFPGFTLLGERVIPLPFIPHTSLAHELMHAWWGAGVGVDHASGNWSEALTTYLADYHLDEQRGDGRDTRRRWLVDLAALPGSFDKRLVDFRGDDDPALRLVGYQHGAMLFHMLRQRIGDEAFDAGLRHFARQHMFHTASWFDLAESFSETADEDLTGFFDAWQYKPGRPALSLAAVERSETEEGWTVRGVLEQTGPGAPWPLRVPVVAETRSGSVRHDVALETRQDRFSLSFDEEPLALAVDPDHDLLRQLDGAPFTLRRLALHPESRLLALDDDWAPLGQNALGRSLASFSDRASEESTPMLVIGDTEAVVDWLAERDLPDPPGDMARRGTARMWTLPGSRVVALSADDRESMSRLAGSLRHHQHRSYLVQDDTGDTIAAGAWPGSEDGLRIDFSR
ncbi:M1 family metallopeptidase [Billgrantia endophytica]|uniref:Peptidase M1 n=1 Tax=Billgrantia endophytica TaxID=2033802 RepID=A0A2N7U5L9_9GAMM|nr:M1 family aminopeptidase [Halomonas endophytica]PMR75726.1 peptidase M1 [Halomonas endophytica]